MSEAGIAAKGAFVAVSLLGGLFALHRLFDLDVLWHLKTGGWILEAGRAPWTDPFGGVTAGEPWLDVAWGGQVAAALIVRLLGLTGLQLIMVVLVMGVKFLQKLVELKNTTELMQTGIAIAIVSAGLIAFGYLGKKD